MRGWVFRSRGKPREVLKLEDDLPRPTADSLGPRDVLVKVKYAGLFQGTALLMGIIPHLNNKPWGAEVSFSGTIVATGGQVTHVKDGDEVFGGFAGDILIKYGGVLSENVVLPAYVAARKPHHLPLEGAAGMGANGVAALQFMEVSKLKRGGRALITGASGGTGSLVVQAARAVVGEEGLVIGTCSGANEQLVKDLGANEIIDYKKHPVLHEYLAEHYDSEPFDAIFDIVGADSLLYPNSPSYLSSAGMFLFLGNMPTVHGGGGICAILRWGISCKIAEIRPTILGGVPRECRLHEGHIGPGDMEKLAAFIDEGKMKPVVDSVYEMEDVLEGYDRLTTSRVRGKIIIHVQD